MGKRREEREGGLEVHDVFCVVHRKERKLKIEKGK